MTNHESPSVAALSTATTRAGTLRAVILAAGYATRMQPLSGNCHKALLSVSGDTILGRIMESLVHIGVERVTVVTGYRADDSSPPSRTPSVPRPLTRPWRRPKPIIKS